MTAAARSRRRAAVTLITTLDYSVYDQGAGTPAVQVAPVVLENGALELSGTGQSSILLETSTG